MQTGRTARRRVLLRGVLTASGLTGRPVCATPVQAYLARRGFGCHHTQLSGADTGLGEHERAAFFAAACATILSVVIAESLPPVTV